MFFHTNSLLSQSHLISYFNGFRVDPSAGTLTVSRLLPHDDVDPSAVMVRAERFREHEAAEVAAEVEDVFQSLTRRRSQSSSPMACWSVVPHFSESARVALAGPGGRTLEIVSLQESLSLRIGYESRDTRHDRDARLSLTISRGGGEPRLQCSYDIGFGQTTFDGLLNFLGLELTSERLEFMHRGQLWRAIREKLEKDGYETNGYAADHLGLSWKARDPWGEIISGHLWTDDCYPSLHLSYPGGLSALSPSFLPLWNHNVGRIRDSLRQEPVRHPIRLVASGL